MLYGALGGIVFILSDMILYLSGLIWNEIFNYFVYVLLAIVIIAAIVKYRDDNETINYKKGLITGLIVTSSSFLISALFNYLYALYVDGIMIEVVREGHVKALEEKGMSYEEIDNVLKVSAGFLSPGFLTFYYYLASLVIGTGISLAIPLLFIRRKNASKTTEIS